MIHFGSTIIYLGTSPTYVEEVTDKTENCPQGFKQKNENYPPFFDLYLEQESIPCTDIPQK